MEVATISTTQYVLENLAGARRWLAEAHALLAQRPAITPPPEHLRQAVNAACNAAEHLYDIGQVDEPVEAVCEALASAEAVMQVVRSLRDERPAINDRRALAAVQLREIDSTLRALEERHLQP
jgi:hypothetical protein